eukprot:TRINITY_DN129_c0_g1_i1.p1 TRINITY_DN129_c0_g1~~TRINITY_DN129_c0_g1_i1.p1  ORF type:complete len:338 (-),score=78.92 TRINITY_DN129_c0_g1_i1:43-1056(-)
MRATTAVVLVLALAFVVSWADSQWTGRTESELFDDFQLFTKTYNKKYASDTETLQRFEIFKQSLKRVEERTKAFPNGATYGITKFSDLTQDEFRSRYLMTRKIATTPEPKANTKVPEIKALPATVDWRLKGYVTPVKDQGDCGSCWAFSATETIESAWIQAGKATADKLALSPQQIVDCDDWVFGCGGGQTGSAFNYVLGYGGIESNASYPYTAEGGSCAFNKSEVVAKIKSWNYANSWYNEAELQQSLAAIGPLSICLDAANWQDYTNGVMTWEECAWINLLDHCVQLVGYNTTAPTPYWIVRNSWNTDWGIDGYIYLSMGSDTCGLAHDATYVVV